MLPEEEGTGATLVWGQGGGRTIRTDVMDPIDLDKAVARGRELRVEAGTMPGMEGPGIVDAELVEVPTDILEACAWVFRQRQVKVMQPAELLAELQRVDEETWKETTPVSFGMKLSAEFKRAKVEGYAYSGKTKVVQATAVHAAVRAGGGLR